MISHSVPEFSEAPEFCSFWSTWGGAWLLLVPRLCWSSSYLLGSFMRVNWFTVIRGERSICGRVDFPFITILYCLPGDFIFQYQPSHFGLVPAFLPQMHFSKVNEVRGMDTNFPVSASPGRGCCTGHSEEVLVNGLGLVWLWLWSPLLFLPPSPSLHQLQASQIRCGVSRARCHQGCDHWERGRLGNLLGSHFTVDRQNSCHPLRPPL